MTVPPSDQCIVLPFRAKTRQPFDDTGLTLHFLVGNVLALHTGLKEMWFGWRVKKIFPEEASLRLYCRNATSKLDFKKISHSRKIRFWIAGSYSDPSVRLHFFDGEAPDAVFPPVDLPISTDDSLVGFRTQLLKWLDSMGQPIPKNQIQAALWPEAISREGLDSVGRALEGFYI